MRSRAFTLIELLLVLVILTLIIAFVFPNLGGESGRRSLLESADRLRSMVIMSNAQAMHNGLRYRISFPGTPDPNDPLAKKEIDVPIETLQPSVQRQMDPIGNPEAYGDFDVDWMNLPILQNGTRCVAVLPGQPSFDIRPDSPIAGPSITQGEAVFVPLTLYPDGTTEWVTFVLTDLPYDTEPQAEDVGHILNVIVDGRTGQTWIQRSLRVQEVELMNEYGAQPIMYMDFTRSDEITEANILEVRIGQGGEASVGHKTSKGP